MPWTQIASFLDPEILKEEAGLVGDTPHLEWVRIPESPVKADMVTPASAPHTLILILSILGVSECV